MASERSAAATSAPRRMQRVAGQPPRLIALYKPYATLCSWIDEDEGARGRATLRDANLPPGVMNIGRLDRDSEGLLLFTDDGPLCNHILQGGSVHKRYFALVAGRPTDEALGEMAAGGLQIRGRTTRACQVVRRLDWGATQAALPPPPPQIARRGLTAESSSWLEVVLDEGMNRQVRKTTAHAGHPTARLVRVGVGELRVEELALRPGEWRPVERRAVLGESEPG